VNWQRYSLQIALKARKNRDVIGSASVDYLMYSGYMTMAYFWAMMTNPQLLMRMTSEQF